MATIHEIHPAVGVARMWKQPGYSSAEVPDLAVRDLIERFDREYSQMLRLLESPGRMATLDC